MHRRLRLYPSRPARTARVAVLEAGARGLTIWEHGDAAILPVQTAYESLIRMIANPEEA